MLIGTRRKSGIKSRSRICLGQGHGERLKALARPLLGGKLAQPFWRATWWCKLNTKTPRVVPEIKTPGLDSSRMTTECAQTQHWGLTAELPPVNTSLGHMDRRTQCPSVHPTLCAALRADWPHQCPIGGMCRSLTNQGTHRRFYKESGWDACRHVWAPWAQAWTHPKDVTTRCVSFLCRKQGICARCAVYTNSHTENYSEGDTPSEWSSITRSNHEKMLLFSHFELQRAFHISQPNIYQLLLATVDPRASQVKTLWCNATENVQ